MSIEEITAAIAALPAEEHRRLYTRLERQKASDPAAPGPVAPREALEGRERRSARDLAKELIGPGSGLDDLSTNPKYMEGFGEGTRP